MSMVSIANMRRISAQTLSELLLAEQAATKDSIAIIDVRDDDYIGGHIKGCVNVPSQTLGAMMPTLIRRLADKKTVVFHCALSQQRGPSAALRYMRERDQALGRNKTAEEGGDGEEPSEGQEQTVYILDRGFVGWQETYGEDDRLTEGYRKEIWQDY